ncbi:MAG: Unknown protein [uncultured Thiotrichaceae bacterium]|uniref:CPXCG motif-containing cysteine-rich protein n=1 Tax=uncultured Thiotrichaceae bacterium TaxID=298394 RepID=A0A6S6SLW8_9GAMM|nr:MAG: Unknown protein [uncultured Thiotrichaceae bacterium]
MLGTEAVTINCPYCAEAIEIVVDCSVDYQDYIEDCFVCCRPIQLKISVDAQGYPSVIAQDENQG